MNLVLIGPQGSGKGTQAEKLVDQFNLAYVSMGNLLRALKATDSPLAQKVASYIDKGLLVPDEVIVEVLNNHLSAIGRLDGIIFDGFPRVVSQAEYFEKFLSEKNQKIDMVIYLTLDKNEIIKRLTNRRTCRQCGRVYNLLTNPPKKEGICDVCGGELIVRDDETPQAIENRLKEFEEKTLPVVEYYRQKGILEEVDGARPIDVIFEDIVERLKKRHLING